MQTTGNKLSLSCTFFLPILICLSCSVTAGEVLFLVAGVFVTMSFCKHFYNVCYQHHGSRLQLSSRNRQNRRIVALESCRYIRQVAAPCSVARGELCCARAGFKCAVFFSVRLQISRRRWHRSAWNFAWCTCRSRTDLLLWGTESPKCDFWGLNFGHLTSNISKTVSRSVTMSITA